MRLNGVEADGGGWNTEEARGASWCRIQRRFVNAICRNLINQSAGIHGENG